MKKRQTRRLEVSFKKFKEITLELKVCGSFPTESKKNRKKIQVKQIGTEHGR